MITFLNIFLFPVAQEYHKKWAPTTQPECSQKVENLRKTHKITWFTARWLNPALLNETVLYTYSDY